MPKPRRKSFFFSKPRILIVGYQTSSHAVGWANRLHELGIEVWIFPFSYFPALDSFKGKITHGLPLMSAVKKFFFGVVRPSRQRRNQEVDVYGFPHTVPGFGPFALAAAILLLRPTVVHSMEFQVNSYKTHKAYTLLRRFGFPIWIASNWGSDIYFFGQDQFHRSKIKAVLDSIDIYTSECRRDQYLARDLAGVPLEGHLIPNFGGFNLEEVAIQRERIRPSTRKKIVVKGYQHFAGRALVALNALELLIKELNDFEVVVYSATPDVSQKARELSERGLAISVLDRVSRQEMLTLFSEARIYVGISVSDGLSISAIEAMAMGCWPIQSATSCLAETATSDNLTSVEGLNPEEIASAILEAARDQKKVDEGAIKNYDFIAENFSEAAQRARIRALMSSAGLSPIGQSP